MHNELVSVLKEYGRLPRRDRLAIEALLTGEERLELRSARRQKSRIQMTETQIALPGSRSALRDLSPWLSKRLLDAAGESRASRIVPVTDQMKDLAREIVRKKREEPIPTGRKSRISKILDRISDIVIGPAPK